MHHDVRVARAAAVWGVEPAVLGGAVGDDADALRALDDATAMLVEHVAADRIADVVRRSHPDGGRSLLDTLLGGQVECVAAELEATFEIGRVQP